MSPYTSRAEAPLRYISPRSNGCTITPATALFRSEPVGKPMPAMMVWL